MRWTIIVLMALALAIPGAVPQTKTTTKALKDKLNTLKKKEQKARTDLGKVRGKIRNLNQSIDQVDNKLDAVEGRFQRNEDRLIAARSEQKGIASRLKVAQVEFEDKSAQAMDRLRIIRMYGQVSFASAWTGTRGLSDLASRTTVLKQIAQQDRTLFEAVKRLRDELAAKKRRADVLIGDIRGLLTEQRTVHAELSEVRDEKKEVLVHLQGQAKELEKLVRQFDAAESQIEGLIRGHSGGSPRGKPGRLSYPVNARITSNYGSRFHPILKRQRMHRGIDFGASYGTTIKSAANGVVIFAGRMSGYGNVVIVDHGGGISTVYAHCSSFRTSKGASVKRGQAIARVGSTGLSTGPHLHFEVHVGGRAVNPRSYL